jgi:hypothetical protein
VPRGPEHFFLIFQYFSLIVFSRFPAIAFFIFCMAMVGLAAILRERKKSTLLFLFFPALYLVFFSAQRLMVVRNYMVLVPFFAVLAARGCVALSETLKRWPVLRAVFGTLIAAIVLVNGWWLYAASESIRTVDQTPYTAKLAAFIDSHPKEDFLVSAGIFDTLGRFDGKLRSNVVRKQSPRVLHAVFYAHEFDITPDFICNRPFLYRWFGPEDVNYNYYPLWTSNRIVLKRGDGHGTPLVSSLPEV